MSIPNRELRAWSKVGADVRSQSTYESIKRVLTAHEWPTSMAKPSVYLQGSYRNHTNIAGDSDVDVVVETSNVFYSDLPFEELLRRGYPEGQFTWFDFRDEVRLALAAHYSRGRVRQGNKCIQVGGAGSRLNADVVPCCEFKQFANGGARGITFWSRSGDQIVNFPELHYHNGTIKNRGCNYDYKRMIRVFKNARNAASSEFPSYFLECMLSNVRNDRFRGGLASMFVGIVEELLRAKSDGLMASWKCQNSQQRMFGNELHQISVTEAYRMVDALVDVWNT